MCTTNFDEIVIARERELFIHNLLVRNHFTIVMIRWTGLAPWEFEFLFPGSLTSTFLIGGEQVSRVCTTNFDEIVIAT